MRKTVEPGVVVTGAGRGIGKRLAIGFGTSGVKVGLIARSLSELHATRLEIQHSGGEAFAAKADVRIWADLSGAVHHLKRKFESLGAGLTVLVASAGIQGPIGPFAYSDPKCWAAVLDTNILGVMLSIRAVLPAMMEQGHGKIIVLAGGGGETPRPNFAPYAASKAAIIRLVETVAEEVRDHNIQINCFAPGGAYTTMTDEILAAGERAGMMEIERAEKVRMTGGSSSEKQFAFVRFLASESSNHISGKLIHVNDDLKKIEQANMPPDVLTLRRLKL